MKIVYDTRLRRPACALLQAAMGGDAGIASQFSSETWLIAPTPGMKLLSITDGELGRLVEMGGHRG